MSNTQENNNMNDQPSKGEDFETIPITVTTAVADGAVLPEQHSAMVDVVAPSDLKGGYHLHVKDENGDLLEVLVPPEGAVTGQRFRATVLRRSDPHSIPTGQWRDGLCSCFTLGCCHQLCCLTFWFPFCALGQILTRIKLDWLGSPLHKKQVAWSAFRVFFVLSILYFFLEQVLNAMIMGMSSDDSGDFETESNDSDDPAVESLMTIRFFLNIIMFVILVVSTMRARRYIRIKHKIQERSCVGCEDCCCAVFCNPCTICQMGRHTADYSVHKAGCCSETGIMEHEV